MLIFPPLITVSLVTGIKSYYQTCWQLLHTSLHSLSTFFSFMMESRKEIIRNPLVTASHCSASPFSFARFQIQCLQSTSAWDQPSISLSQSFALLSLFPRTILAVFWVLRAYSPCLSILLRSLFALRRLHSASYPFLKSAFQSGSCLPPFFSQHSLLLSVNFLIVPTSDGSNFRAWGLETTHFSPIQFGGPLSRLFRSGFQNCLFFPCVFGSQQKLV